MNSQPPLGTLEMLRDADYAAEYLSEVLQNRDATAFAFALRNVIEARGGLEGLLERIELDPEAEALIRSGKPITALPTLIPVLRELGLRVSVESSGCDME